MKTTPQKLIDLLCEHPYYEDHERPSVGWLLTIKKKHNAPMSEVEVAISNILARNRINPDDMYNPEMVLSGSIPKLQPFKTVGNKVTSAIYPPLEKDTKEWQKKHKKKEWHMEFMPRTAETEAVKEWYYQTRPNTEVVYIFPDGEVSLPYRPAKGERPKRSNRNGTKMHQ